MNKNHPTLSIVVPTYNRIALLKKCLVSIDSQTDKNFTLIISDNCSTDGTYEYIKSRYSDAIIINRNYENLGIVKNINQALNLVKTQWATILQDDDYLDPCFVAEVNKVIHRTTRNNILVGHRTVNKDYQVLQEFKLPRLSLDVKDVWETMFSQERPFDVFPTAGISAFIFNISHDSDCLIRNYYRGFYSDYLLFIETASKSGLEILDEVLYNRMMWDGSVTGNFWKAIKQTKELSKVDRIFKNDLFNFYKSLNFSCSDQLLELKIRKYCESSLFKNYTRKMLKLFVKKIFTRAPQT